MLAFQFEVTGTVQGVYFRRYAQDKAKHLSLVGWVQNDAGGSVTGLVQGSETSLQAFHDWLYQGSPTAHVDHVEWQQIALQSHLSTFDIRA